MASAAAAPIAIVSLLFGEPGRFPFRGVHFIAAVVSLVLLALTTTSRVVRTAAVLAIAAAGLGVQLQPIEKWAFYDAVAENAAKLYDQELLRELVHDVVQTIKGNLKVDWTESHREDVKAEIRAAVKRVLRRKGVSAEHFDLLISKIMQQAEALYADWPKAA